MARDHRKLRAFNDAHELVVKVYRLTSTFPVQERFGLTEQIRRGVVSIAANVVEGCARRTEREYAHFVNVAAASGREVEYLFGLAAAVGLCTRDAVEELTASASSVTAQLQSLVQVLTQASEARRTRVGR